MSYDSVTMTTIKFRRIESILREFRVSMIRIDVFGSGKLERLLVGHTSGFIYAPRAASVDL
jgi:hypothetical protein